MMLKTMAGTSVGRFPQPLEGLASQLLKSGRRLKIKARGGSMTPFLRDGDIALIAPAPGRVHVGDVVCYETAPGRLFLHRVVSRRGARVVAKGDALPSREVISLGEILGTVTAIERGGEVRRLDTRAARWASYLVAWLSPALSRLVPVALELRRVWRAAVRG